MIRSAASVVIANGKGGAGKTSLVANLVHIAATQTGGQQEGWRVLAVDLDSQGNLGDDLGYADSDTDKGAAIRSALLEDKVLPPPLRDVRPNLDVYPGGPELLDAEAAFLADVLAGDKLELLGERLEGMAGEYDLVVFDTAPSGHSALARMALTAARGLVIPVRHDKSSKKGMGVMADVYRTVVEHANPGLELLGVVQFELAVSETRARAKLESDLREILPAGVEIFTPPIRHSNVAAEHMRDRGITVLEYEAESADWIAERFRRLRMKLDAGPRPSQAATGLADDYFEVVRQILVALGATATESTELAEVPA